MLGEQLEIKFEPISIQGGESFRLARWLRPTLAEEIEETRFEHRWTVLSWIEFASFPLLGIGAEKTYTPADTREVHQPFEVPTTRCDRADTFMTRLDRFALSDMVRYGAALRGMRPPGESMQDVARALVSYLYDELVDESNGARSCALIRFFKTHPYGALPPSLREIVRCKLKGEPSSPDMKCLTLLATRGERDEWNAIADSVDHQVIPLPSPTAVRQIPMILRLVEQFGLEVDAFFGSDAEPLIDTTPKSYNVFYVSDARSSPHVPARDFVENAGIESVLGFGGMLSSGDLFAIIMFSKVHIPRNVADLFRTMTLNAMMVVESFARGSIFSTRS